MFNKKKSETAKDSKNMKEKKPKTLKEKMEQHRRQYVSISERNLNDPNPVRFFD
jgi:hypothetical protein